MGNLDPKEQVNDQFHGNPGPEAHNSHAHSDHVHSDQAAAEPSAEADVSASDATTSNRDKIVATAATIGVVGVAAVVFEAALIPGMILGVAAVLAPTYVPRLGAALNPLFRSTIRGAYKLGQKTKEAASEVREQMSDIAAEVNAEIVSAEKSKPAAL
ncbi:MAG: DUF5132 domain-containing protein [Beijerinckiaceae bacterium]|nr:DUF5132 domain-containing protein [Beijerinckiaceae bacterium]